MIKLFISKIKYYFTAIFFLTLQSCANVEQYHQQPLVENIQNSVTPDILHNLKNGSLFQQSTLLNNYKYKPLFEDHRPHNIGDTVTIILQENISASNSSVSNLIRNGNSNIGVKINPGTFGSILGFNLKDDITGLDGIEINNFHGLGSNAAKNQFTGLITATVYSVLPNGNLKVIGNKKVSINNEIELIRFSGVINPHNVNKNNCILSTNIANAKIEYLSRGHINYVQKIGWFQRLLLKISPI